MKIHDAVLIVALLIFAPSVILADSQLNRTQILDIFKALTDHPRFTWIPSGTIQAEHQEFSLYNGYSTDSSVLVKFDGNRFYWETNTNSMDKTAQTVTSNNNIYSDDYEEPILSKKRISVWDGEQYTMYFGAGKHAIVTEDVSKIPAQVNGPLTAGVIPWGEGIYTYESLSTANLSGVELDVDGRKKIYLDINMPRIPEMYFTLDPEKGYAVLSHSYVTDEGFSIALTCNDYELVSGHWIPEKILIEKYDYNKNPAELFASEYWSITSVDILTPALSDFDVTYGKGTLVEYYLDMFETPFSYHHAKDIDTDNLLQESMLNKFRENSRTSNCATVAMRYTASELGKQIEDSNLAQLITQSDETTSLYSMKDFLQKNDLHCLAVNTDIQTLKNLIENYQVILHLPDKNHYVVLQNIDDKYVWLIDLNKKRFFYRKEIKGFSNHWDEGTALLISKEPISIQEQISTIGDKELHNIIGSDGVGNYSCTKLIQQGDVVFCMKVGWLCGGRFSYYNIRYGCEPDENGGVCTSEPMIGKVSWYCTNKLSDPFQCDTPGDPIFYYIRACQ
ncbi:MAG: cysteine peptidase family C39 domain-containing protein [Planctomycetota bacterium]|jgi:hypothetical protein